LNIYKASGLDRISTTLLKETAEVTAPLLKLIFEKSLNTGDVPYDWRIVNVTPVYKKENAVTHKIIALFHLHLLVVKY